MQSSINQDEKLYEHTEKTLLVKENSHAYLSPVDDKLISVIMELEPWQNQDAFYANN